MLLAADTWADPVLLCNDLGAKREADDHHNNPFTAMVASSGHHSMSVKEAVRIAQSNNFMGLVCSSRLLVSYKLPYSREAQIQLGYTDNI